MLAARYGRRTLLASDWGNLGSLISFNAIALDGTVSTPNSHEKNQLVRYGELPLSRFLLVDPRNLGPTIGPRFIGVWRVQARAVILKDAMG